MGCPIILVIDGNTENHKLFQSYLGNDFEVVCISTGRSAVELVGAKKAAVVFVSHSLPDSPGFELVRILKHNFPLLPTIITAESPSKEVILSALRNDAKDFLEIPFDKVELVKIIQRVTNAIPLSFDPQTLHRSNQQKVKKSAARLKDFVVRYLTNKRNANNSSDELGSEITNDSSDHILKTVSDEKESIIIERMTGAKLDESVRMRRSTMELKGYFLGNFHIEMRNRLINQWPSHKGKEILAYLLYHHKKRIFRDQLMAKFWPDSPQECAKNSLNVALHGIRKMFHEVDPTGEYILFKNDCYYFNPEIDISLDLEKFLRHWKKGRSKDQSGDIPAMLEDYKLAVSLYKGDFIEEDLYVDWITLERENLLEIYLTILARLSYYYSINGKPLTAVTLCERILSKDKCREDIHRRLMKCHYRLGQRDKAIKQFQKCVAILDSELGVGPTRSTLKLYEKVKSDTLHFKNTENFQLSKN